MRFDFIASLALSLVVLFAACSTEVDLIGEGEPVPVVYGILDAADSLHFLKVMKSFSGEAAATELLQEELLYFSHPDIRIKRMDNGTQYLMLRQSIPGKEPGIFPAEPNYQYVLKEKLSPGLYAVVITGSEIQDSVYQEFTLFNDLELIYPSRLAKRIYFYDDPLTFTWRPSEKAGSYEIAIQLSFEEVTETETAFRTITYSRTVLEDELEWLGDRWKFRLYSDPFFATVSRNITDSPAVIYRKPVNIRVTLTAADQDLTRFMKQDNPDTPIPVHYTGNLTGALGIVAAKYSVILDNKALSPKAMDSLRSGRFTKSLRFIANPDW